MKTSSLVARSRNLFKTSWRRLKDICVCWDKTNMLLISHFVLILHWKIWESQKMFVVLCSVPFALNRFYLIFICYVIIISSSSNIFILLAKITRKRKSLQNRQGPQRRLELLSVSLSIFICKLKSIENVKWNII